MGDASDLSIVAISEIRKKLRLLNAIATFVVVTLIAVILRYLFEPLSDMLDFLPEISIAIVVVIVLILGVVGLVLSWMIARQVVGSIKSYSLKLDTILNLTKDIRDELYGDILLEKIMDFSLAITDAEAGSIMLLEDDNLLFKTVKGVKAPELLGTTIPKETGIAGYVLKHGEPLYINDAEKDGRFNPDVDKTVGSGTGHEDFKTRSILCVPLKTSAGTIGIVEILNKRSGPFGENDIGLTGYLADHAAISIERAQFYEDQRNYEIHITDIILDTVDRFVSEKQGHSRRVAKYANIIAKALVLDDRRSRRLYFASLLHDIGFLRINPEDSFRKEEYSKHPVIGYEMLSPISFYKDISPFILHHHEWYDGYGYPGGLKGEDIPLESRIIAVAEAFDTMVSRVSYRLPVSSEAAVSELIHNSGTQFDPLLVDLFVNNLKGVLD